MPLPREFMDYAVAEYDKALASAQSSAEFWKKAYFAQCKEIMEIVGLKQPDHGTVEAFNILRTYKEKHDKQSNVQETTPSSQEAICQAAP